MINTLLSISPDINNIDIFGILVSVVGYVVVFTALLSMYFVFQKLPILLNIKIRFNLRKQGKVVSEKDDFSVTGEVNAAISTALFLYFNELHDDESNVITINKVSKSYSPWSSKIYGLRNFKNNKI